MEWTLSKSEVWLSSVDITWTREFNGYYQRLFLSVSNEDDMFGFASHWESGSKIRSFKLDHMSRRFVTDQKEITDIWDLIHFEGESV